MTLDIFMLDWILIDTLIIIILIFILVNVKIFKVTHRWRSSFSDESLERLYFKESPIKLKSQSIFLSKWLLVKIKARQEVSASSPIIFIARTNRKKRLINILAEGFSSYGFIVIIVKMKIKPCPNCDILDQTIKDETKYLCSSIINYYKQNKFIQNTNFILLTYSKSSISYSAIASDIKNVGIMSINPRIDSINVRNFSELLGDNQRIKSSIFQLCIIFSKKSIFFLENRNLTTFLSQFSRQVNHPFELITLEKSKKSFKYYETILLSVIIDYIEKISLNSQA